MHMIGQMTVNGRIMFDTQFKIYESMISAQQTSNTKKWSVIFKTWVSRFKTYKTNIEQKASVPSLK